MTAVIAPRASAVRTPHARAKVKAAAVAAAAALDDRTFDESCLGLGTVEDPCRQPLRDKPNASGCQHCPTARCDCDAFAAMFDAAVEEEAMKRVTETAKRGMCAKSLMPNFIARAAALLDVQKSDVFYDFGSGNGSVLFQMAFLTGARCVGIELSEHNATLSRRLWDRLRPKLEAYAGRPMPEVTVLTGDVCEFLATSEAEFNAAPRKVLFSNLVIPKPVTNFVAEALRKQPKGARVMCWDDLYPHARSVMHWRDPEAFELFEMRDYVWPMFAVEWTASEGQFYVHTRK